jgi:CheY-like chemotaxis protein
MAVDEEVMTTQETPPESFAEQVKQVLEHLYDFSYLQRHPLAHERGFSGDSPGETASQSLRREAVAAIEALSPGAGVAFRAPHARPYNLLYLHYIEGSTIQEAAHELGISVRQAYRDLRRGEESVATLLWSRRANAPFARIEGDARRLSSLQAEMARLETHPQPTDLQALMQSAHRAVEQLALQRGITFQVEIPPEPVIVSADMVVARQVLISALSGAIQQAQPGALHSELIPGPGQALLRLHYRLDPGAADIPAVNPMITQLATRLGWTIKHSDESYGLRTVTLNTSGRTDPIVLVIDDNQGLVELLDRYLTGHHCRVIAAGSGQEGLRLAQELSPDAIILDIMMPETDGWEVLQILRTRARTVTTPIIICSVVNDPELAYSLGVSLFIPKPVSRDKILTALRQLNVV